MSNGYKVDNISIEQYLDSVIEEDIREDHPAQREFCWKKDMTDGLLYSAISRKIFIPSFVLVEETQQDGSKEVYIADALQRTVSLKMFKYQGLKISNNLKTYIVTYEKKKKDENGHYVRDENGNIIREEVEYDIRGKKYDDLPKELKKNFDKCQLSVATYLDCNRKESTDIVFLYNNHLGMNTAQKGHTYAGEFTTDIKRIKNENRFLIDCTCLTENEKEKGVWERVISETVMAINHYDKWKKSPKDINKFLSENSSSDEFEKVNEYFNRLIPFADKMENKEVAQLFVSKNIFVWMMLFDRFSKFGIEDDKFGGFLNAFVVELKNKKIRGKNWEDIDSARNTKDRKIIDAKLEYLETLLKEFLEIKDEENNGIEEQNLIIPKELSEYVSNFPKYISVVESGVRDEETANKLAIRTLKFARENVSKDKTDEDIELYLSFLDDFIRTGSPLLKANNLPSLVGIMAYVCDIEHDEDFVCWFKDFESRNPVFKWNQKENYTYMKADFDRYVNRMKHDGKGAA